MRQVPDRPFAWVDRILGGMRSTWLHWPWPNEWLGPVVNRVQVVDLPCPVPGDLRSEDVLPEARARFSTRALVRPRG